MDAFSVVVVGQKSSCMQQSKVVGEDSLSWWMSQDGGQGEAAMGFVSSGGVAEAADVLTPPWREGKRKAERERWLGGRKKKE